MTGNTDPIKEQLLADARAMSPDFSEALHQRTLRALRRETVRRQLTTPVVPWWRAGLAVVATLALAASGWWIYSQPKLLDRMPAPQALVRLDPPQTPGMIASSELQQLLTPPRPPILSIERQVKAAAQYVAGQFPPSVLSAKEQPM